MHLMLVETSSLTAWMHRARIAEMQTRQPTLPAISVANAAEALALYAVLQFRCFSFNRKGLGSNLMLGD